MVEKEEIHMKFLKLCYKDRQELTNEEAMVMTLSNFIHTLKDETLEMISHMCRDVLEKRKHCRKVGVTYG